MGTQIRTVAFITCDNNCDNDWPDGVPCFPDPDSAVHHVTTHCGWMLIDGRILCSYCAETATCQRTSHRMSSWHPNERHGVTFRHRWCQHCQTSETDPPREQLDVLVAAARILNAADPT